MLTQSTLARFAAALALAWVGACGGDDDDQDAAPVADGAPPGDASPSDAAVVDCSGDHRESADSSNDPFSSKNGSAERTELALAAGGAGFWMCGQLDPAQATGEVIDYDAFEFTVGGDDVVNLRIELLASDAGETEVGLELYRVDDGPPQEVVSGVPVRNNFALIAGLNAAPGRYWVSALGRSAEPPGPIGYAIRVAENELECPAAEGMANHVEAGDGADGRGNDTVTVHLPKAPALTEGEDAPEETGLTLEPEAVAHLRGISAAVESPGDSYLDRDTYLVTTGATADEVELRVTWPDGMADLDVYLFDAGDPANDYSLELGTEPGKNRDELMTLNLDPQHSYWLWVGAFDEQQVPVAVDYDITLCPRAHVSPTPPK